MTAPRVERRASWTAPHHLVQRLAVPAFERAQRGVRRLSRAGAVAEAVDDGEERPAVALGDEVGVAVRVLAGARAAAHAEPPPHRLLLLALGACARRGGPLPAEDGRAVRRAARAGQAPRQPAHGRVGVELVEQAAHGAESCAESAARRDAVARRALEVVDARPLVAVEQLKPLRVAERRRPVQVPALARVARRVGADLLHDDGDLGQLVVRETEAARVPLHRAPRGADLRLVRDEL